MSDVELKTCKADADCVIVEDVCPGAWSVIHKDYVEAHEAQVKQMRPVIECMQRDPNAKAPERAFCENGMCAMDDVKANAIP